MSSAIILIAVGDPKWCDMAINMCLSIRANDKSQKVALIYNEGCIKGNEELVNKYFDIGLNVFNHFDGYIEFAFWLKTQLYDYATSMMPDVDTFIYLDSDCIMLPGQPAKQWFDKHEKLDFTSYCNDIYDYTTKTRSRKDYTFWCDPEEVLKQLPYLKKIPQTNSSFLYFKKGDAAKELFDRAKAVWDDTGIKFQDYKGAKPDELCFNIACAITGIMPHQTNYRPIFFTFASETQNSEYILHWFKAFGFAGIHKPATWLVNMYNSMVRYYRDHFSIVKGFTLVIEQTHIVDPAPIDIRIISKRTLFRREEVENSAGGIFNPDGILLPDGSLMTIYRKEPTRDIVEGYKSNSALPHVHILGKDKEEDFELSYFEKPENIRYEDFRLFMWNLTVGQPTVMISHSSIIGNLKDGMTCVPNISYIGVGNVIMNCGTFEMPFDINKIEKNWGFIGEGDDLFIIYSLSPYRIFKVFAGKCNELSTKPISLNWFHKSFISNSTNPILIGDHYLLFFHSKENGIYHHGAALIDAKSKEITHYTRNSIKLRTYADGFQPGLLYLSGSVYLPKLNRIRLFIGEGDSHSICNDYDATEFMDMLKCYPVYEAVSNDSALNRLKTL